MGSLFEEGGQFSLLPGKGSAGGMSPGIMSGVLEIGLDLGGALKELRKPDRSPWWPRPEPMPGRRDGQLAPSPQEPGLEPPGDVPIFPNHLCNTRAAGFPSGV